MLRSFLQCIRHSADVTQIFTSLGYRAAAVPYGDHAHVRARWRGFVVVARDSTKPTEAAGSLARQLASQGERGLAVCVGFPLLAIAAPRPGTTAATRVLTLDVENPSALGLSRLRALAPTRSTSALAHALRIAEVLSAEAAGDRFFRAFRTLWHRMAEHAPDSIAPADRRLLALLTLTRMLFLYFVQAKGWLTGDRSYLRSLLDHTLAANGDFHRDALEPLFFRTLNRPLHHREHERRGLPYLNGGLFEPHPIERQVGGTAFTNAMWVDAFDNLFDRYHFCVQEAQSVDAVAPDMLGRVFERLMESEERSRTGTFFTPEDLVREVVEDGLTAALHGQQAAPTRLLERLMTGNPLAPAEHRELRARLRALRILDPAVGSGAFLLGALHALTELHLRVSAATGPRAKWDIRRSVLRENLFGVDINPLAVRLAELRLWLAVVADDPATAAPDVEPLPNLDGVVRQGDTLFDPVGMARAHLPDFPPAPPTLVRRVAEARDRVFAARGGRASAALRDLRQHEATLAGTTIDRAIASCEHHIRETRQFTQSTDLFGKRLRLTRAQEQRYRSLEADLTALQQVRRDVARGVLPFFSFEVHAPDIVEQGGFDLVVGNPPWVRAERLAPLVRKRLRQRFNLWRAAGKRGYRHLPDLAVAFLERSLELTRSGGVVALLVPGKLTSAGYAQALRHHLAQHTTLLRVHRIADQRTRGFGATTYPLQLVVQKSSPHARQGVRIGGDRQETIEQERLTTSGPWILVPNKTRDALEVFCAAGRPLHTVATPHLGVKTGADRVLVGRVVERQTDVVNVQFPAGGLTAVEPEVLRPALRGRDVQRYGGTASRVLLWGYDVTGKVRAALPPLADTYVSIHVDALNARADFRGGPPWRVFREKPVLLRHRVVWPDITSVLAAVAIDEIDAGTVPLNTCYVAAFPSRAAALAATTILNSSWATAYVQVAADEARGGYRRCNASVVGQIPLPTQEALASLSALGHRAHHHRDVSNDEIDAAVAQALGLSSRVQDRLRALTPRR